MFPIPRHRSLYVEPLPDTRRPAPGLPLRARPPARAGARPRPFLYFLLSDVRARSPRDSEWRVYDRSKGPARVWPHTYSRPALPVRIIDGSLGASELRWRWVGPALVAFNRRTGRWVYALVPKLASMV